MIFDIMTLNYTIMTQLNDTNLNDTKPNDIMHPFKCLNYRASNFNGLIRYPFLALVLISTNLGINVVLAKNAILNAIKNALRYWNLPQWSTHRNRIKL